MAKKKTKIKDTRSAERKKIKRERKKEDEKKESRTKVYVMHRNKVIKMTQSFFNDKTKSQYTSETPSTMAFLQKEHNN